MKNKCSCQICKICTCGQHHCRNSTPPAVLPKSCSTDAVCQLTEYRDKFHHNGKIVKRSSKKIPEEYKPLEGKISGTTTFQSDYVAHPAKPRSPKPTKAYVAPIGVMLLKTTYMNDFRTYTTQKSAISKTEEYKTPNTKMETLSVYNDVYRAWKPQPQTSYKKADNLKVNDGTIDMTTTTRADYCQKPDTSRRKSFKPEPKVIESLPFEGKSVYHHVYVRHPIDSIPQQPKTTPYKPNSAPFEDISIHRQDYKGDRSSPVQSCKVKATWEPRLTPFEGKSECQDRFQAWSVKRIPSIRKADYSPPEGDMELTSTAHMEFRGAPGSPAMTARPSIRAWNKGEPFEARSTTQDHFRAWEGAKRGKSLKPETKRPPLPAFEGTTTFRSEFTPKKGENVASFKPVQRLLSPFTMESNTMYRSTFRKHEVQPCPACFSHGPQSQCLCLGKNGHILCPRLNIPPKDSKVITRPSTADTPKSRRTTNTRPVKSAGLTRRY